MANFSVINLLTNGTIPGNNCPDGNYTGGKCQDGMAYVCRRGEGEGRGERGWEGRETIFIRSIENTSYPFSMQFYKFFYKTEGGGVCISSVGKNPRLESLISIKHWDSTIFLS